MVDTRKGCASWVVALDTSGPSPNHQPPAQTPLRSVSHSLYTGRPHTRAATRPLAPPRHLSALQNSRKEVRICIARREHCALHSSLLLSRNLGRNRTRHSFASSVASMLLLRCNRAPRSCIARREHCVLHSSLLLRCNLSRDRTRHSFASSVAGMLLLSCNRTFGSPCQARLLSCNRALRSGLGLG